MKTIEEQLTEANARAERLQTDLTASQQLAEETQNKLTAETARADAAETRATAAETATREAQTALSTAQADNQTLTAKVTKLEGEAKTADERAQEIVAGLGHKPVQGKQGNGAPTGDANGIAEQFAAITDPAERTEFYRKHKAELAAVRNK